MNLDARNPGPLFANAAGGIDLNRIYAAARGLPPFNGDRVALMVPEAVALTALAMTEPSTCYGRAFSVIRAEPLVNGRQHELILEWLEPPVTPLDCAVG